MSTPRSLEEIQRWLQAVITHPVGISAGIAAEEASTNLDVTPTQIERVILPSQEMTSLDRLQIYGRAYFARLIECLKVQFPAVHHAVADQVFDALASGYIVQHPSTRYTLGELGDSFDEYLTATRPPRSPAADPNEPDFGDFLIELARLERIYGQVFDGPGPERSRSLQPDDIADLSPTEFARCRLRLHSCVRLLKLQFPVHDYASSVRQATQPDVPAARALCLVITRRDYIVRRFEVTSPQFDLLSALDKQMPIGEAIAQLCTDSAIDLGSFHHELHAWFRDWSAAPLFAELLRDDSLTESTTRPTSA